MRLTAFLPNLAGVFLVVGLFLGSASGVAADALKLVVQRGYLPGLPALVRVEVLTPAGTRNWSLWDGEALLTADAGVTLSTNRIAMRNGMGSALVTFSGGGDFNLTATVDALQAMRPLLTLTNEPVQFAGGTNAANTVWSGVVRMTNHVGVPTGFALTVLSNTLVLIDGLTATNATTGLSFYVNGRIDVQGTEDNPVTFTCSSTNPNARWGQMRFNSAALASAPTNLLRHAIITRAGRVPGEGGHTGQGPVIRPTNAKLRMELCSVTDHATSAGTPGKIGQANGSDLVFDNCLFQRARMGPEIAGTALLFTNGVIMDMLGNDDADGIYIHAQSGGQVCALKNSVVAAGGDDGIDTLDSAVLVEGCIIRDWASRVEDAKGISAFNNVTTVRRSLIVDCTVGVSAKTSSSNSSVRVNIFESTLARNATNVLAQYKSNASGPRVDYRITNSILWSTSDSIHSDFAETNFTIGFCNISEPWPGTSNSMSDPLFTDAAGHDFRLLPFSPSIDSGDPQSPSDPDGSRIDQGCYTFLPGPPLLSQPMLLGGTHRFTLTAYSNRNYVVESSDILPAWTFLKTVFQTNETGLVLDPTATNAPHRFYRARLAP